ncbi:hypothetical protein N643_11585 [Salmonella bongori serovar 48:z41:-- str. RKS3044]|nr:hypothetical protein N643_11585 [Salmonella bongori serovar 48:z41:-- str. RKS3044]
MVSDARVLLLTMKTTEDGDFIVDLVNIWIRFKIKPILLMLYT